MLFVRAIAHAANRPAHHIPHSTLRDDRAAPLVDEAGYREKIMNFRNCEAECFSPQDWTAQISLMRLVKTVSSRMSFPIDKDAWRGRTQTASAGDSGDGQAGP
jgi:hypothetical protein